MHHVLLIVLLLNFLRLQQPFPPTTQTLSAWWYHDMPLSELIMMPSVTTLRE